MTNSESASRGLTKFSMPLIKFTMPLIEITYAANPIYQVLSLQHFVVVVEIDYELRICQWGANQIDYAANPNYLCH